MHAVIKKISSLTHAVHCKPLFLTLFITMFFNCSSALAFDDHHAANDGYGYVNPNSTQPFATNERKQRLRLVMDYARRELPSFLPGLPSGLLHDPMNWVGAGWLKNDSLEDFGSQENANNIISFLQPVQSALRKPDSTVSQALWLDPDYHHKGFLPFQDAVVLGLHMRSTAVSDMFHNSAQIDIHPFYGQNWHSEANYWGAEASVNFTATNTSNPWGNIAMRFSQGNADLMDRGSGFDMHSQLNFNDRLSLNAGIRENGNRDAGNYAMLRWKMPLGN